jgi:hypothetical protein
MRRTLPDAPRAFKTPLVPLVPILGIVTCLYMMIALPPDTWIRLVIWMIVGFDIYLLYGAAKSRLGNGTFKRSGMKIAIASALLLCILLFVTAWWHHYDLQQQGARALQNLTNAQTQNLPTVAELSEKYDDIMRVIKNDILVEIANYFAGAHFVFFVGYFVGLRNGRK